MAERWSWYVGIDWGSAEHEVCLISAEGQVRATLTVAHTVAAVHEAVQRLERETGVPAAAIRG